MCKKTIARSTGYEATYWAVTIYMYIPGIDPALNQKVYFVVTSTALDDSESGPSSVVSVALDWPAKPGTPMVSNTINLQGNTAETAKAVELVPDGHSAPQNLVTVQLVQ